MASTAGQRWTDGIGPTDPAPPGPVELRRRISELAEQVRRLSAHDPPLAPGAPTDVLASDVIAMAERAAEEIRANARREAARVALGHAHDAPALASVLVGAVARQRETIAVLAAEIERLGQSAEQLLTHVRVLEDELGRIDAFLRATIAPAA
jgi:hypothetical protein